MKQAKNVNTEAVLKVLWKECHRAEKAEDWGKEAGLNRAAEIVEWFASRPAKKKEAVRPAANRTKTKKRALR